MVSSLIALAVLGAQGPTPSDFLPWLELQHEGVKARSASLLSEARPDWSPTLDQALMGNIQLAMANEMTRFANEMYPKGQPIAGSGDGDDIGGFAFLCGLLGFFPGFGIGHLVAGNISGFVLFLVIDVVMAGVFFILFPTVWWFSFWYLPGIIVFLVERVVEAFLAANSAYRYRGYHRVYYGEDAPAGGAFEHLSHVKPAFTLLNF